MAFTKEKLAELGIAVDATEELTQEKIDELVLKRLTELTGENSKQKTIISQRNGEIADYKRKEQDRMSEDEKKALHEKEMVEKIASYEKQIAKTSKVAEYMSIGYPKELAEKVADCEIEGKSSVKYHQEFAKSQVEATRAELMRQNPTPNGGGSDDTMTVEKFKKLKPSELAKFAEEHPTEFENFASQTK